jgi:hypothetical protein
MKSITTLHHDLPMNVSSKQIIKSLIGSLNATAIAYARGHLRFNAVENIADPSVNGARHRRLQRGAERMSTKSSSPDTVVARRHGLRSADAVRTNWPRRLMLILQLATSQHFSNSTRPRQNDVPLSIAETVKFQMSTAHRPTTTTCSKHWPLPWTSTSEMLKAAQTQDGHRRHVADLKASAGKVVTYLEAFESYDKDAAGHVVAVCVEDETSIESSVRHALPAHVQYKLMFGCACAHTTRRSRKRCSVAPAWQARCSRRHQDDQGHRTPKNCNAWLGHLHAGQARATRRVHGTRRRAAHAD